MWQSFRQMRSTLWRSSVMSCMLRRWILLKYRRIFGIAIILRMFQAPALVLTAIRIHVCGADRCRLHYQITLERNHRVSRTEYTSSVKSWQNLSIKAASITATLSSDEFRFHISSADHTSSATQHLPSSVCTPIHAHADLCEIPWQNAVFWYFIVNGESYRKCDC